MKRFLSAFIVLFLISSISPAQAVVKAGAKCTKAGVTASVGGKKFTCIKSGKKLVWNKGTTIKKVADVKQGIPEFGFSIAHEAALAVKDKSAVEARHRISSSIAQVVSKIIWTDPFVDFRLKNGASIVYKVPDIVLKRTKRKDRKILD